MEKLARWALVLLAMAIVLWVRTRPLALPIADDWADQLLRQQLASRIAQEAQRQGRTESPAQVEREVQSWVEDHAERFDAQRATTSESLRSRLRYVGPDGREHVFLGDVDSYQWLRAARNYLDHGTTCDAVVNGECRDTLTDAPVGARMIYNRSLHIAAIVAVHEVITFFHPGYPLASSSFWVPVLVGVLGVLPAFGLGWRLGGDAGGFCAALLVALDSSLLMRSIGSDNDVWNVVLPLFLFWAAVEALAAGNRWRRIGFAVLAGVFAGLHAATWSGWIFGYLVLLAGLAGTLLFHALRLAWQRWRGVAAAATAVRNVAVVLAVFYVSAGVFTTLAGAPQSYFDLPLRLLDAGVADAALPPPASVNLWPSALATVAELGTPNLGGIADSKGGKLALFGALLGLVLLLQPEAWWRRSGRWRDAYASVLVAAVAADAVLLFATPSTRFTILALVTVPLLATVLLRLLDPDGEGAGVDAALLVTLWFLAAFSLSFGAVRFLLLLGPAFGLALGGAAGRLQRAIGSRARRPFLAGAAVLVLSLPLLLPPLWGGYRVARAYVPKISDAWWGTLTNIRDHSAPDAIVDALWDYGYWVKYVAQRRVSCDGGTLSTHVHRWFGRALVTPSETESIGLLRMLNCGSDATPQPEGAEGAYGKIVAKLHDPIAAAALVTELASLDEDAARAALAAKGFTAAEQANVLRSTHCRPPESFLLLTTQQLTTATTWMQFGRWDLAKAYVAEVAPYASQQELVPELRKRFGYSEQEATSLYAQARQLRSVKERENFAGPSAWYLTTQWVPCRTEAEGKMLCPLGMVDKQTGDVLEAFVYDPTAPERSRLRVRHAPGGALAAGVTEEAPAALLLADAGGERGVTLGPTTVRRFGALVDVPNRRVLVGSPFLLRSTFVQLMYLDGRYAHRYQKFDERVAYNGERIEVWRVRWGVTNRTDPTDPIDRTDSPAPG